MKKLLLFLVVIAPFTSCDPLHNDGEWYVENTTEQTLRLKFSYYSVDESGNTYYITIPTGRSMLIYGSDMPIKTSPHFDYYFRRIIDLHGEDVYWQILSEDDVVLKTWNYSKKGLSDQRFFEDSSWAHSSEPGSGFAETLFVWTFNILPEDIQSTD